MSFGKASRWRVWLVLALSILVLVAVAAPLTAQGRSGAGPTILGPPPPVPPEVVARDKLGRATIRATRIDQPIGLDGLLDDAPYATVRAVTDFIQQEPDEGVVASERTEVWLFFDDRAIYISARCWDSQPERMVANEMRRDSFNLFGNEQFSVILDTFYDRRNGFNFLTNPLGGMFDAQITNERTPNLDWNTVWDVKTGRFDEEWTVEMRIPFRSLRYRAGDVQVWGVNVQRRVAWKNESSFPYPPRSASPGSFSCRPRPPWWGSR